LVIALAVGGAPKGRLVYTVDLERAASSTSKGKKIRADLEKKTRAVEENVRARRAALKVLREKLERTGEPSLRAQYDVEVEALDALITDEEKKLDDAQSASLQPLLDALEEILERMNKQRPELLVIDQAANPAMNIKPKCDATAWLVRAHETASSGPPVAQEACRTVFFFYVDLNRLMKGVDDGKQASERLDAFQKQRQADLETHQADLRRLELAVRSEGATARVRGDYERARIDLAERYSAFQKELADRERVEERKVREAAIKFVDGFAVQLPGALFIDGGDTTESEAKEWRIEPNCEVTTLLIDAAHGRAGASDLLRACQAYGAPALGPGPDQKKQ
jgi:Skp family chaperone for outer membrane proteins